MAYIIRDVDSYRAWNKSGTVVNCFTGEPKKFETHDEAKSFVDLSQYRRASIEAVQ